MTQTFSALDIVVLVAYLLGTTLLGIRLGRAQRDARDYFVADRAIPWWAVLFSVVASETSALTFISIPGLAYLGNLGFLQVVAGYVLGRFVVAYTLLPRYYEGELVTAYALLEKRFGLATRRFTSIVFMVTRGIADSVRVFATAIPVALIIGPAVPRQYVMPLAILILGALTILYTYKGGMRAVVWTELVQAGVYLLGGVSAIVLLGAAVEGGWGAIFSSAAASELMAPEWVLIVAARMAATMRPVRPDGIRSMMNVGKIASAAANGRPWYRTNSPTPTRRKSAICASTTKPLPMIARWASRRLRDDSNRCTIS